MEGQIDIINLPIDLVSINCVNAKESLKALNYCNKFFNFNNVILFTNEELETNFELIKIKKLNSIKEYNDFILTLNPYIKSDFALIVQDDGHIVNPNKWNKLFLDYDYIGAPWPNNYSWKARFKKKYNKSISDQIVKNINYNQVGNGGFSLRSKKFLEYSQTFSNCESISEDIFLCIYNYEKSQNHKIKFPNFNLAKEFSYEMSMKKIFKYRETKNEIFNINEHFGWHGKRFKNYKSLLNLKNLID